MEQAMDIADIAAALAYMNQEDKKPPPRSDEGWGGSRRPFRGDDQPPRRTRRFGRH